MKKEGPFGKPAYVSQKGELFWAKNVRPEYRWYRGSILNVTMADRIDPVGAVVLSRPQGSVGDAKSRISPFKIHRGRQPYDREYRNMVGAKLLGPKGSGAFWQDYDWEASAAAAMNAVGLPFSGSVGFVETEYCLPVSHMVAPKEAALSCAACHAAADGRMAGLSGMYLPGRDRGGPVDFFGTFLVALAIGGVSVHGLALLTLRSGKGSGHVYE